MIPFLITVLVDLVVGIVAFSNRQDPASRTLAFFVVCLGFWQTELYLLKTISDVDLLSRWFHVTRIGMFLLPFCLAKLTWQVCGAQSAFFKRLVLWPLLLIATGLGLINNTYSPSVLVKSTSGYLPVPDAVYVVFLLTLLYTLITTIGLALRRYQRTFVREKRRLRWLLITLSLAVLCAGCPVLVFIFLPDAYLLSVVSAIGNIVFLSVLLYSIVNYHLTDVSTAIGTLLAQIVALGLLISAFFIGQGVIDQSGNQSTMMAGQILLKILLLSVLVSLYPRLLRLAKLSIKKLALGRSLNYKRVKQQFHFALKRCLNNDDLAAVMDNVIQNVLGIMHYRLFIADHATTGQEIMFHSLDDAKPTAVLPGETVVELRHQSKETVLMHDEVDRRLSRLMTEHQTIGVCPLWIDRHLVGLLCVGVPMNDKSTYYRYDEIRILELITQELPETLTRIARFGETQIRLANANKTLSVIELMNQYQHEIKAPLSIIDGVLSNDLYDRETQRDIILEQVSRGTQLVSMMNSILREKHEPQCHPLNIMPLIRRCALLFKPKFKNINYDTPELPLIQGDKDELSILFINIFKNAAEAKNPNQPLSLLIKASENDGAVWVSICDTGLGMDQKQVSSLWTPNNESSKDMGSGIGLSAVKRIASEHGATIEVSSEKGIGSTFRFGFPVLAPQSKKIAKTQNELCVMDI